MRRTGILEITCPELLEGVGMEQNKWHAYDVWRHGMECMDACEADPVLRIAALLHDVGKPRTRAWSDKTNDWTFYDHDRVGAEIAEPIAARLRFSNDERERIVALVRFHLFHYSSEWTDAAVRRWIRRVGRDRVEDLYVLNAADVRAKGRDFEPDLEALAALKAHVARVLAEGAALSTRDLQINGHDLMRELGVTPGRIIGEILDALLDAVTADPSVNDRERLLALARELLKKRFELGRVFTLGRRCSAGLTLPAPLRSSAPRLCAFTPRPPAPLGVSAWQAVLDPLRSHPTPPAPSGVSAWQAVLDPLRSHPTPPAPRPASPLRRRCVRSGRGEREGEPLVQPTAEWLTFPPPRQRASRALNACGAGGQGGGVKVKAAEHRGGG